MNTSLELGSIPRSVSIPINPSAAIWSSLESLYRLKSYREKIKLWGKVTFDISDSDITGVIDLLESLLYYHFSNELAYRGGCLRRNRTRFRCGRGFFHLFLY